MSELQENTREQAFYVVCKDGRKLIMTLDSVFGENDEETESCIKALKEAFVEGESFFILNAEEAFKSFSSCECRFKDEQSNTVLICEECSKLPCHNLDTNKLWAVNIPPEPDSILFHPVPSLKIAQELTERLKKEAIERFKINGDLISDSIYFEEWKGTEQEHTDYLLKHGEWWIHTTFLDEKTSKDVHDKTNDLIQRAESYLEEFGSSGKIADCLIQELINQLRATNYALAFMTDCHKEWSEMAIKQKAHIERVDAVAKQQIAYHQSYVDKYINNDVERANRHIERINAWQSIISLKDN